MIAANNTSIGNLFPPPHLNLTTESADNRWHRAEPFENEDGDTDEPADTFEMDAEIKQAFHDAIMNPSNPERFEQLQQQLLTLAKKYINAGETN